MVRTKVFVGNLSFATKENELAKEFETAGKVISANIITRGPRSLGYGFVEMDNESDAENAVKLLNKKEIDGRPINVEVAKLREEGAEGEQPRTGGDRGGRGNGRGGRGGARGTRGRGFGGGFRRGGERGGSEGGRRFRRVDGSDEEGEGEGEGFRRRGGFRGGARGGAPRGGEFRGRGGRGGGRPRQEERKEENRTPSQTTLFIANLPFSLDDEGFGKVFKDNGLAFKSAHVVKRRSGRSKGFGFAEFDNEGDQQKALNSLNNKPIDGRELVVKVALTEMRDEEAEHETSTQTNTAEKKEEAKTDKPVTPKTDKK